jgi:heme/copper-type cytochrome/quinol oxidase subunit 4
MIEVSELSPYLLLLLPIALIQLGLMLFALVDLLKRPEHTLRGPKVVWALVIIFVNIIGPILYFLVAREDV